MRGVLLILVAAVAVGFPGGAAGGVEPDRVRLGRGQGEDTRFRKYAQRIRQRTQGHRDLDRKLLHERWRGRRLPRPSLQRLDRSPSDSGKRVLRHDHSADLHRDRGAGRILAVHDYPRHRQLARARERQGRNGSRLNRAHLGASALAAAPGSPDSGQVRAGRAFTLTGSVGGLYPGASRRLVIVVRNRDRTSLRVRSITTRVRDAKPGCRAGNLRVSAFRGRLRVGAGRSRRVAVRARMPSDSPSACQGAVFPLVFRGRATR
jgi:hypothetical protein